MTIEEAIRILDPETSNEALEQYPTDIETLNACVEAQNIVFGTLRGLLAFKNYFDDLYGTGLGVANWHMNGDLKPFDEFYERALALYEEDLANETSD